MIMTDDELKQLVANLAVSQKETDTQIKETDIQLKETGRKLDKVAKMLGGISENQGNITEDFFYNSFIKNNHLGRLAFDDITKNMKKHRGKIQEEYDIFLTNGEAMAIVEVKYKAHLEDISKLERKFNNFKKLFPIYKDYELYGAMASFYFNQETKDELLKQGFFVVERSGELISTENSEGRVRSHIDR